MDHLQKCKCWPSGAPMLVFGSIQAAVGGPVLVVGRVGSPWRASGRGQQASRVWPPSVEASVSV